MKNLNKVFTATLMGLMLMSSALIAQDSKWSIDVNGGAPFMLSNVKASGQSLYGGGGLRYSITPVLSAQVQLDGGVLAANRSVTGTYFSYDFMQYSVRGILNVSSLINQPKSLSRFNAYLYLGAGQIKCYSKPQAYSANDISALNKTNSLFYVSTAGLNIRYYLNEYIDLLGGSELNFTQTTSMLNSPKANNYDKYALNYIGISFKILPATVKKQHPDWLGIKLPYDNYDEMLKVSQAKAAAAEAKSQQALKDAKMMVADANSKLAKSEEYSSNVISKISSVRFQLDTLKEMIADMKEKGTYNSTPNNEMNPANSPAPSYSNLAKNTKASKHTLVNSRSDVRTQKSLNTPNIRYVNQEIVKSIDVNKKFAVVLGSFVKYENAVNAKQQLTDKGYQVNLVNFDDPNVQRLVIYYDSKDAAQKQLAQLRKTENAEAWLLTIDQLTVSLK